jgi:hypothetical protein
MMHTFIERPKGVYQVGHYEFIDGNTVWRENVTGIQSVLDAMLVVNYFNGGAGYPLMLSHWTFIAGNVEKT